MNTVEDQTHKWHWMMEYCKKRLINPAESWAWKEAEKTYELKNDQGHKND